MAAFLQSTRSFSQPLSQLSQQINNILNALAGAERIFSTLDEQCEDESGSVSLVYAKQSGSSLLESDSKNSKVQLVSDSSVCGWISNGSLTSKKIVKTSGGTGSTSSDELALAGKGFSAEAEKAFKDSGNAAAANYSKVDEIEKITVSKSELSDFISDGHLNGGVQ